MSRQLLIGCEPPCQTALTRRLHSPLPAPRETAIYFYGSVVSVSPTEARIYYACGGVEAPNTTFLAVAVSHDGVATFTKPNLGLIAYNGSKDNNLVFAVPFDGWPNTGRQVLSKKVEKGGVPRDGSSHRPCIHSDLSLL